MEVCQTKSYTFEVYKASAAQNSVEEAYPGGTNLLISLVSLAQLELNNFNSKDDPLLKIPAIDQNKLYNEILTKKTDADFEKLFMLKIGNLNAEIYLTENEDYKKKYFVFQDRIY